MRLSTWIARFALGLGLASGVGAQASEGRLYVNPMPPPEASPYVVEIPNDQLMAIGRVNPLAALALLQFTRDHRAEFANLLAGEVDFGRRPTLETVSLLAQGADDRAVEASQAPLPGDQGLARVTWHGTKTGHALQLTLSSWRLDAPDTTSPGEVLYPAIVVTLQPGPPGRISAWGVQETAQERAQDSAQTPGQTAGEVIEVTRQFFAALMRNDADRLAQLSVDWVEELAPGFASSHLAKDLVARKLMNPRR